MIAVAGKNVLVTGAAGTVGRELIRQLCQQQAREIRALDHNESEVFYLEEEFGHRYRSYGPQSPPGDGTRFRAYVGDVRDERKLLQQMEGVDVVFHAAALKHVVLCEQSPFDAVQTNIMGTRNVIDAALAQNVERVVFTSSDKAVNPTSVMGTSKLMGERLITAANSMGRGRRTVFSSTRFGNVVGSRGSVVPIFEEQILRGGPVTLTSRRMTRFIMTIRDAVRMVLEASRLARGGEVFVTKMPVVRIADLAEVMIDLVCERAGRPTKSIEIVEIGAKPGEKSYEELMTEEEAGRAVELDEMFSILPAFRDVYEDVEYTYPTILNRSIEVPYVSERVEAMSPESLRSWLIEHDVLAIGRET